jgi:hypothetical protein
VLAGDTASVTSRTDVRKARPRSSTFQQLLHFSVEPSISSAISLRADGCWFGRRPGDLMAAAGVASRMSVTAGVQTKQLTGTRAQRHINAVPTLLAVACCCTCSVLLASARVGSHAPAFVGEGRSLTRHPGDGQTVRTVRCCATGWQRSTAFLPPCRVRAAVAFGPSTHELRLCGCVIRIACRVICQLLRLRCGLRPHCRQLRVRQQLLR